jgi:hypothetical protein
MSVKTEWAMACPKCGSDEYIDVAAVVWVRLTEDGTDADQPDNGNHEWDDDSRCTCGKCGHNGTVRDFEWRTRRSRGGAR